MADVGMRGGGKKMPKLKGGQAVGKSKVISSGKMTPVRGGTTKMFGDQTVKASKKM